MIECIVKNLKLPGTFHAMSILEKSDLKKLLFYVIHARLIFIIEKKIFRYSSISRLITLYFHSLIVSF